MILYQDPKKYLYGAMPTTMLKVHHMLGTDENFIMTNYNKSGDVNEAKVELKKSFNGECLEVVIIHVKCARNLLLEETFLI